MSTLPARKPGRRGRRTGTLVVIAALLAASGTIRMGVGVAEALVRDGDEEVAQAPANLPGAQTCTEAAGISSLLEALTEREMRVAAREAALEERLQALALAERRLVAEQQELGRIEAALAATLALADRAAEEDLLRLTTVYETMKPKEAAILFEEMDPTFAAGFLSRMRPEAAAGVMAGMTPRGAYTLSVILAGRNAGVPTQ
jgi:flagellar motility protein MotE (MotC chaperone)